MTIIPRLENELRKVNELARQDHRFSFRTSGLPPSSYYCTWRVAGLERLASGEVRPRGEHRFLVHLGGDFPFEPPSIFWQTPIFHPNFRNERVCLGTIWFGGSTIADLCMNLRRMITLQDFNVFDPLDSVAAAWLREKLGEDRFFVPLDSDR